MDVVVAPDGKRGVRVERSRRNDLGHRSGHRFGHRVGSVGQRPWGIALTPDGGRLYTANGPSNDVSVVDTGT